MASNDQVQTLEGVPREVRDPGRGEMIEDNELPGMWEQADIIGGKTDSEEIARLERVVEEAPK